MRPTGPLHMYTTIHTKYFHTCCYMWPACPSDGEHNLFVWQASAQLMVCWLSQNEIPQNSTDHYTSQPHSLSTCVLCAAGSKCMETNGALSTVCYTSTYKHTHKRTKSSVKKVLALICMSTQVQKHMHSVLLKKCCYANKTSPQTCTHTKDRQTAKGKL